MASSQPMGTAATPSFTVEERVRLVSEQLALVADVFALIAVAADHAPDQRLSGDAARCSGASAAVRIRTSRRCCAPCQLTSSIACGVRAIRRHEHFGFA